MHPTTSPRNDDEGIESAIQAKGLTAPRVTPADIEANIASEHYFTAYEGVAGRELCDSRAMDPSKSVAYAPLDNYPEVPSPLDLLTFCVLVLRNGFTVVGKSACASPENFDAEIGRRIARADALNQMWPLMGYELKSRLARSPA